MPPTERRVDTEHYVATLERRISAALSEATEWETLARSFEFKYQQAQAELDDLRAPKEETAK